MISMDTHLRVAAVQREALERLGPAGRLRLAFEMSEDLHDLALAGLRHRHPDWSEDALRKGLLRLAFGADGVPAALR